MADKLKLLATVIVIFGVAFGYHWWTNQQEEKILAKVHELTNAMCECKTVECADPVLKELLAIGDEELRVGQDGAEDNWQKAHLAIDYMQQCYKFLQAGQPFNVERYQDGRIRIVRPIKEPQ